MCIACKLAAPAGLHLNQIPPDGLCCAEEYTAPLSTTLNWRKYEFITLLTLQNLLNAKMKEQPQEISRQNLVLFLQLGLLIS